MGAPQSVENAVRHGYKAVLGLLGPTTAAAAQAKLYGWKKYALEDAANLGAFDAPTQQQTFAPLVDNGFYVQTFAGGATPTLFVFAKSDFANVNAPLPAEIVAAFNARVSIAVMALEAGGHLSIRDAAAAATTSVLTLTPIVVKTGSSKYGDALEILGFVNSTCDVGNFKLTVTLNTDQREPRPPVVQVFDWSASTNVAGPMVSTQPVYSYDEGTGILTLTNALNAAHTVEAMILG